MADASGARIGGGSRKPRSPEVLVTVILPDVKKFDPRDIYEIGSRKRIRPDRHPIRFDKQIKKEDLAAKQDQRIRRAIRLGHQVFQVGIPPDETFFVTKKPPKTWG